MSDISQPFPRHSDESSQATEAFRIIETLADAGFVAYLAGGCVRDALLGRTPKDYDIATDATPESVRQVFGKANTLAFGASFGVIGILPPKPSAATKSTSSLPVTPTEVATFRSDGEYSDGRRPDSVHFGNAQQDALRRDFTINGLFYDPVAGEVVDFVDGKQDLAAGILRTIGSPHQRFAEDKLRMLRAIRFATTLGFQVDPATTDAIMQHAGEISVVSGERIGAEMRRVMTSPHAAAGLRRLQETGLADHVMPGLSTVDSDRLIELLRYLPDRSFPATLACVEIACNEPDQILRKASREWKLSTEEIRKATAACKHHPTLINAARLPWSKVQPVLVDRDRSEILSVAEAVAIADSEDRDGLNLVKAAIQWPSDRLDPPPLLTGDDLRADGIPVGPQYKILLEAVRQRQLNGEIDTTDQAWETVKHVLAEKRT